MSCISFIEDEYDDNYLYDGIDPHSLCLFNGSDDLQILKYIPRNFTITTNNSSAKFNIDLLTDTSQPIKNFIEKNPNNFQYHIDIKDENNVLAKIEKLYLGERVIFNEEDLPASKQISQNLEIYAFPNYMKPKSLKTVDEFEYSDDDIENGVIMNNSSFKYFLTYSPIKKFTIKTKSRKYECNFFGLYYSKFLREILMKDPTINMYEYDYEDKFNEFQEICDLFNFATIKITVNNVRSIHEISENLQIESILEKLNKRIDEYDEISRVIDDQQTIIDTIEELFDQLYHIKEKSVENVKNFIVESNWVKTEDDVRELAAFILRVSKTDIMYQPYLADLLIQLEKEANDSNFLRILNPFLVNKLITKFGINLYNCSFVYYLYKKGIISRESINDCLSNVFNNKQMKTCTNKKEEFKYQNIICWFFKELIELNLFDTFKEDFLYFDVKKQYRKCEFYFNTFYINKLDLYDQMRNSCEPDDAITKSLRNDDIDSFQTIISNSKIDISKEKIPFNIFEIFVKNDETSYIDYAAAYGSIKCFKYLLLNHAKYDKNTFKYALYGGNIEIINILDQHDSKLFELTKVKNNCVNASMMKHNNDLFDWILENKITEISKIQNNACKLLLSSVKYGNAHAFAEIVDKGIDFSKYYEYLIEKSSKKGFYKFCLLIDRLYNNNNIPKKVADCSSFITFGNLSIFKIFLQFPYNKMQLQDALSKSISYNYIHIVKFLFENMKNNYITTEIAFMSLNKAIRVETIEIFVYLIDKYSSIDKTILYDVYRLQFLLDNICSAKNIVAAKIITKIIVEISPYSDFSKSLLKAIKENSFEICKFFIDTKVFVDYQQLSLNANKLGSISENIFLLIINSCDADDKYMLCNYILYPAIQKGNIKIVKYLLDLKIPYEEALIEAVKIQNIEIVDMILKYNSKPYFINKKEGLALNIAIENDNLQMVKKLLSIKGIDLNLYNSKYRTPLIFALLAYKFEITDAILDFYGDEIEFQKWQIEQALKLLLDSFDLQDNESKRKHIKRLLPVIKRILKIKNINTNCCGGKRTLLTFACEINEIDIVKILLSTEIIDVNLCPSNSLTPLMTAINYENIEIAKLLIEDPRININARNYNDETALTISAVKQLNEIVDLLIHHKKFDPEESFLNYAFFLSNEKIMNLLCKFECLDVNYQRDNETKLTLAAIKSNLQMIDLIINHPSFDKHKSFIKKAIFISIEINNINIFRKLIELENDLINYHYKNETLLHCSVKNCRKEIMLEILNNPKYKIDKNDVLNSFLTSLMNIEEKMACVLDELLNYDKNHNKFININQYLPNGETYFTLKNIKTLNSFTYVNFLIKNGADPNIPNKSNVYPLERAIKNDNFGLIEKLLDTKKIDLKTLIPNKQRSSENDSLYKTYLQLAAQTDNEQSHALSCFIERNEIDVNVVDDKGETALMEACRNKIENSIRLLFEREDLDYLHKNKNGEDALEIVLKMANATNNRKLGRQEYCLLLIHYISEMNKKDYSNTNKSHRYVDYEEDSYYD